MEHSIELRPARDDDFEFIHTLRRATFKTYVDELWGWDDDDQRERLRQHYTSLDRQIILLDGQPVGELAVERRDGELVLNMITISPAYQGQGIGSALVRRLMDEAAGKDVPVTLRVLKNNPARFLYERFGFVYTHEIETHDYMAWRPPIP